MTPVETLYDVIDDTLPVNPRILASGVTEDVAQMLTETYMKRQLIVADLGRCTITIRKTKLDRDKPIEQTQEG